MKKRTEDQRAKLERAGRTGLKVRRAAMKVRRGKTDCLVKNVRTTLT